MAEQFDQLPEEEKHRLANEAQARNEAQQAQENELKQAGLQKVL